MSKYVSERQLHQSDQHGARLVLLVPRTLVKEVKTALEKHAIFDRHHGISPDRPHERRMRIHVNLTAQGDLSEQATEAGKIRLLTELDLTHIASDIALLYWTPSANIPPTAGRDNPLRRALKEALQLLPPETLLSLNLTVDQLVSTFPDSYSVYTPLLLLPSSSLGPDWKQLISTHASELQTLWSHLAPAFSCTQIALNSPIPPSNASSSTHFSDKDNILRSPVNITPLHGSFGPAPTSQSLSAPTQKDFDDALWVSTMQNGIRQTWAPLYTMFSRGNVKEKARILKLASANLASASAMSSASATTTTTTTTTITAGMGRRKVSLKGATAVDMYAGIGYFSFSYRRAGFLLVLCFELNPWSVEGLRRGAALNGWSTRVFTAADVPARDAPGSEWEAWRDGTEGATGTDGAAGVAGAGHAKGVVDGGEDFLIFAMSNEYADAVLRCLRDYVSPVRHVNLGLLPVSRLSWSSAARAVDRKCGGWIHAHENVGVVEMDERREEVNAEFQRLVDERDSEGRIKVSVEHVEKVKMYAPGVVHAVFDVYIPGTE
jgi:tRNA wybutosine-synthesizing protein 2